MDRDEQVVDQIIVYSFLVCCVEKYASKDYLSMIIGKKRDRFF